MKVRVVDFQSIKDQQLEFSGFTVITGSSNLGKTALLRAIDSAIFGRSGDYYVRHGSNRCAVVLIDDADKIRWQKVVKKSVKTETFLEVNGKRYTKLGRDQAQLTEVLGFAEITAGGVTLKPQIAAQHDDMFLLRESPAVVADLFKVLGRIDVVNKAQSFVRQDIRQQTSELRVRESDKETLEGNISEFGWVESIKDRFTVAQIRVSNAKKMIEEREQKLAKIANYKSLHVVDLPTCPTLPDLPLDTLKKVRELQSLEVRDLPDAPTLPTIDIQSLEKIKALRDLYSEFRSRDDDIAQVEQEITQLASQIEDLETEMGICPLCNKKFSDHD